MRKGIAAAWLISAAFNSALTIPTTYVDENGVCQAMGKWPSKIHAKVAGIITVVLEYFIPLGILIFCYGGIGLMLKKKMDPSTDKMAAAGASEQREKTMSAAYRNTIKTLALVSIMYVVCWSGNQVYFLIYNLGYDVCWCDPFYITATNLVNANCCVNPIVYVFTYEDFKNRAKEMLGLRKADIKQGHSSLKPPIATTTQNI